MQMEATTRIEPAPGAGGSTSRRRVHAQIPDDKAMLRTAAELTRDINVARADIYWPDMIGSALAGYALLAAAILLENTALAIACGLLAVFPLYRALLFIHEITHLHRDALPGFRTAWNLIVGIPLLTPSLMYENVHTLHHSRMRYGTAEDPEYMALALMKPWSLPLFVLVAALAPVGLLVRWGVLAPLGLLIPALRRYSWERLSSLSINPVFRRRPPEAGERGWFLFQQVGASLWAIFLLSTPLWLGWKPLLVGIAVTSAVATFNQLRTLVAHLWENDGEAMTVTAQYLDSVNVHTKIGALWAPVGLRYHALHHLLPSLPYHSLPLAHRRISEKLGAASTYEEASHPGLVVLVMRIARSTMGRRG